MRLEMVSVKCQAVVQISLKCVYKGATDYNLSLVRPMNGLPPKRRQIITWSNADQVLWRHVALLGINELNFNHVSLFLSR